MSIFDFEFYPTSRPLIEKMLEPFIKSGRGMGYSYKHLQANLTILEPSAGSGHICDYLQEFAGRNQQLYCLEKNPDLKTILQEKNFRVIGDDFLRYKGDYLFDLIVMNPPFSNGDAHLLKAWEILEEGDIVCLLNAETILNPYSEKRKHLCSLIEKHGSVEFLGKAFSTAERSTDVEVALVRMHKVAIEKRLHFSFEPVSKEKSYSLDETTFSNPIATRDVVANMLLQYEKVKELFCEYIKIKEALEFYATGLTSTDRKVSAIALEAFSTERPSANQKFNYFSDELKLQIWHQLLSKTNLEKYMTHGVKQHFTKFSKAQGYMDFTKENVASLLSMIFENRGEILEKAIVDVFDIFTRHHEENRYLIEGWKTNSKWKVNRKVILPYYVECGHAGYYQVYYKQADEYKDIEKVMCYLTGTPYEELSEEVLKDGKPYPYGSQNRDKEYKRISLERAISRIRIGSTLKYESEFFYLRCYKKGTLHIEFKSEFLWNEFNMRACIGKAWLPEREKKAYQERKAQEQTKEAGKGILKALACSENKNDALTSHAGLPISKASVCSLEPLNTSALHDATQFKLFA